MRVGAFATFTYERDSSLYDDGIFDSYQQVDPGAELTPIVTQSDGDPVPGSLSEGFTALYDEQRGVQELNWTSLLGGGIETENHSVMVTWLYSRAARDTAIFLEDTRGKEFFFPGYDPDDMGTPGHSEPDAAPYNRIQTLDYRERITTSMQFRGRHVFPFLEGGLFGAPEVDWTVAQSYADSNQPDRRQFASVWTPEQIVGSPPFTFTRPQRFGAYLPVANINVRNYQRLFQRVEEDSFQWFANLKLPFEQWDGEDAYFKLGYFSDEVERTFDQESFDRETAGGAWEGAAFTELWTDFLPFQDVTLRATDIDADYLGRQDISGFYMMVDLPLDDWVKLTAGVRFESTEISIDPTFESLNLVLVPNPGGGFVLDCLRTPREVVPPTSPRTTCCRPVGLTLEPTEEVTIRLAYSQTIARPNFKELTVAQQQEFLGGPVFVGNADLVASALDNFDVRVDYRPYDGGWFPPRGSTRHRGCHRGGAVDRPVADQHHPGDQLSGRVPQRRRV